ncbi:hypothetical protein NE865_11693 [Phthorimaea operculella]|nr:hypothetical protein NE865_11693 [Phthorimaea operculella]
MKSAVVLLALVFCYVECRKIVPPIDKNANLAFINMEAGGVGPRPAPAQAPKGQVVTMPTPAKPAAPAPAAPAKPSVPVSPQPTPKPVVVPVPAKPLPPTQPPQIQPKPVNPAPAAHPVSTPGPGSVKQLVNFYDSQGKASPIRPYSYSQAVKQGKH